MRIHIMATSAVFAAVLSCGPDNAPMVGSQVANDRGGSSPLSGENDATACDALGATPADGCGAVDHTASTSDVSTIDNSANAGPTAANVPPQAPTPVASQPTQVPPVPTARPTPADSNIVEFHIQPATGNGPWNAKEQLFTVQVGKTLRIINDDTVPHRLHTDDRPCPHQPANMPPGGFYDCRITQTFDPGAASPIYDHNGSQATTPFWVKAVP